MTLKEIFKKALRLTNEKTEHTSRAVSYLLGFAFTMGVDSGTIVDTNLGFLILGTLVYGAILHAVSVLVDMINIKLTK